MAAAKIIPLVAGNWKMNGLAASEAELARIISGSKDLAGKAELMVCPPATLVAAFAGAARGSRVLIGAQDCHAEPSGAHTGDIAAEMLADGPKRRLPGARG
jgi:triosephosphate isomerase